MRDTPATDVACDDIPAGSVFASSHGSLPQGGISNSVETGMQRGGRSLTPERVTLLEKDEVFVFGSNYAGRHGKGAALLAVRKFGARRGQGMGAMGQSYGISTKDERLRVLPLARIEAQVARFLRYEEQHSSKRFLVTQIGCGLAGYKPRDIAPMFADSPDNISLPACFVSVLDSEAGGGGAEHGETKGESQDAAQGHIARTEPPGNTP